MSTSPPRAYLKRIVGAPAADIFAAWTDLAALAMADAHPRLEHSGEYQVIQLTERGSHGTEIEITHELATEGEASAHAGRWGQLLARLQAYLEDTCRST